jgi:hypothetical protein
VIMTPAILRKLDRLRTETTTTGIEEMAA